MPRYRPRTRLVKIDSHGEPKLMLMHDMGSGAWSVSRRTLPTEENPDGTIERKGGLTAKAAHRLYFQWLDEKREAGA